jgi:hypothetical protein
VYLWHIAYYWKFFLLHYIQVLPSRHGPHRKHRSFVVGKFLPWKHACLRSRYLAAAVVLSLISRSLPSNGSTCRSILILVLRKRLKLFSISRSHLREVKGKESWLFRLWSSGRSVTPCSVEGGYGCFGGRCSLHHRGWSVEGCYPIRSDRLAEVTPCARYEVRLSFSDQKAKVTYRSPLIYCAFSVYLFWRTLDY